ncbi:MAG: ROK family protein [Ilumatobacteraceae bacterium]
MEATGGMSGERTSGATGEDMVVGGGMTEAELVPDADGVGRPTVGVDFGGTKALMVACWPDGTVEVEQAATGFGSHRHDLEGLVESFVAGLRVEPRVIGLAVPGLVHGGKVVMSDVLPSLDGWEPASRWVDGPPVLVENDVRAGLAHVSHDDDLGTTALIMAGTGIAVAVRTCGVVIAGANGWAGELGSIPISTAETVRTLDELASGASVVRRLAEETVPGDEVIAQAGRCLGLGIATVVNLFNPSRLVLGGGALRHEGYLANAVSVARTASLASSWDACTVEEAADDRLVALGVARLAAAATSRDPRSRRLVPRSVEVSACGQTEA